MSEHTEEPELPSEPLDYQWLDELLDRELEAIAEELEAGGKISPADFSRLVEYHRASYPAEPPPPQCEWRDEPPEARQPLLP